MKFLLLHEVVLNIWNQLDSVPPKFSTFFSFRLHFFMIDDDWIDVAYRLAN